MPVKLLFKDDFVVTDHSNLHAQPVFQIEFRTGKFLLGAFDSLNRGLSQLLCPSGSIDAVSGRSTAGSSCLGKSNLKVVFFFPLLHLNAKIIFQVWKAIPVSKMEEQR